MKKHKSRKKQKNVKKNTELIQDIIPAVKLGRPLKFQTADELYAAGIKYIQSRTKKDINGNDIFYRPVTVVGLAMSIGLDRKALITYSGKNEAFSYAIKKLKSMVEDFLEERTHSKNPTGAIFNLRANYGYQGLEDQEANKTIEDTMKEIRKLICG